MELNIKRYSTKNKKRLSIAETEKGVVYLEEAEVVSFSEFDDIQLIYNVVALDSESGHKDYKCFDNLKEAEYYFDNPHLITKEGIYGIRH